MIKKLIAILSALTLSFALMGQDGKFVQVGADASMDCFLPINHVFPSVGLGVFARVGRPDQWVNFIGGLRYIYGVRMSGFQVPLKVNVNLIRGSKVSGYVGGGFEFDFAGRYLGSMKAQTGVAGKHFDFRVFYKFYQGDLGAGFTYYF